ncbi:hypothetical protein RUM43_002175, partial [Polyplax serrata]
VCYMVECDVDGHMEPIDAWTQGHTKSLFINYVTSSCRVMEPCQSFASALLIKKVF